jgi:hypothetical protein
MRRCSRQRRTSKRRAGSTFSCAPSARGRRPRAVARTCSRPGATRAASEDGGRHSPGRAHERCDARDVTGLQAARAIRAHRTPPAGLHSASLCKRPSAARPGGERGAPAERSAAGHESAGADKCTYRPAGPRSARARWEAGRDPRARALPRGRRHQPLSPEPPAALSPPSCPPPSDVRVTDTGRARSASSARSPRLSRGAKHVCRPSISGV